MSMPQPAEPATAKPVPPAAAPLEVRQPAAAVAQDGQVDPADAAAQLTALVTIRHESTGEQRVVGAAALPFFLNQGYHVLPDA
jgi:hypothetical protein